MSKENYSYGELVEFGIEVCASCGGANINYNYKVGPPDYCRDCKFEEGTNTVMPDNEYFYNNAKEQLKKIRGRV